MGNTVACFSPNYNSKKTKPTPPPSFSRSTSRRSAAWSEPLFSSASSNKKDKMDDAVIREHALAAALLYQHHQKNGSDIPFSRSASVGFPASRVNGSKKQSVPRSCSSTTRLNADALLRTNQLVVNQDVKNIDGLETKHFVLVHGGGYGAWSWYKIIALLEEAGFEVDAVDLIGSGVHSYDTNTITSLAQYVKPLTDFLEKLQEGKKVILVGHDFGGACVSYAMELFPSKVAKAIFIAAAMLTSGQSTLDMFSKQKSSNELRQQAQIFFYGNGKDHPPTAMDFDKALIKDLFFNQSPAKDVALASVSMRPIPIAPIVEKLSLSDANYGRVRRFYIETREDFAIPIDLQETMINSNPPEKVFQLRGSDHSPFFSRPQSLHKLLVEISNIP